MRQGVSRAGSLAGGHVNIQVPEPARTVGGEEKRLAVRSDERLLVDERAVHRGAHVKRGRPGVEGGLARGDPKVSQAEAAQTVRVQEQLQTIEPDAGALLVQWAAELRHQDGWSPRAVRSLRANVDVEQTRQTAAPEVEHGDSSLFVLQETGSGVCGSAVDPRPGIDGLFPPEVIVRVRAPGDIDVAQTEAARTVAVEVHRVPVTRKGGGVLVGGRVDRRPQVHGLAPGILAAGALRDPDVVSAKASRAVRIEVETQAILGERRAGVDEPGVDGWAEVDRRRPLREPLCRQEPRCRQ